MEYKMKVKISVCQDCGYEERIKIYDREDAERLTIKLYPPTCKKCGSRNVKTYD